MIRYAKESSAEVFLIGTEEGILHPLRKANPGKTFHLIANSLVCPDMKKTRLETIIETMELKQNIVTVHEEIKIKAKQAIDRMLAVT